MTSQEHKEITHLIRSIGHELIVVIVLLAACAGFLWRIAG